MPLHSPKVILYDENGDPLVVDQSHLGVWPKGTGIGAAIPDPAGTYPAPAAGEKSPLLVDTTGLLALRGQSLTDEESWYDDFIGAALGPDWTVVVTGLGSVTVANSLAFLSSGLAAGSQTYMTRPGDYAPLVASFHLRLTAAGAEQATGFGLATGLGVTPVQRAYIVPSQLESNAFDFITQADDSGFSTETTHHRLPTGTLTSTHDYELEVNAGFCTLKVDGVLISKHALHVPYPYSVVDVFAVTQNATLLTADRGLLLDAVHFSNHNQVEINNHINGEALVANLRDRASVQLDNDKGLVARLVAEGMASLAIADDDTRDLLRQAVAELRKINMAMRLMVEAPLDEEEDDL